MARERYISVDFEGSGPIPGEYSMLSVGACVVGDVKKRFYAELKPLNSRYVAEALRVCRLSMSRLKRDGKEPRKAMDAFARWVARVSEGLTPIFCSWSTADWLFVKWYLVRFGHPKTFSHSGLEMKSYYAGMMNVGFGRATKRHLPRELMPRKHTHNALDDAIEQAELYEKMFRLNARMHARR